MTYLFSKLINNRGEYIPADIFYNSSLQKHLCITILTFHLSFPVISSNTASLCFSKGFYITHLL